MGKQVNIFAHALLLTEAFLLQFIFEHSERFLLLNIIEFISIIKEAIKKISKEKKERIAQRQKTIFRDEQTIKT